MKQALSKTFQQSMWDWYSSVCTTRMEATTSTIIVHTRWHDKDLIGQILQNEPGEWIVVSMPAETGGQPLWPSKFSIENREKKKKV